MDWNFAATWISVVIAAIGLMGAYIGWRKSELRHEIAELRREDVYEWSNQVIENLQTLFLLTLVSRSDGWTPEELQKIENIRFSTSILVEKGRLLFKNDKSNHGRHKEPAYRGLRPRILDQIVIAYQIASMLEKADLETRNRLSRLAEISVKRFVSLAQQEVGRDRAACAAAKEGGEGVILSDLLAQCESPDVDQPPAHRYKPT